MLQPLTAWAKNVFTRRPVRRRRASSCDFARFAAEVLEIRTMLAVTLAPLIVNDLPNDKTEFVAANVTNTNPITSVTFTATKQQSERYGHGSSPADEVSTSTSAASIRTMSHLPAISYCGYSKVPLQ